MKLLINSTPIALWQSIIQEAGVKCGVFLKEDLESYLVFLLMRYQQRPELVKQIIASEYLQGLTFSHQKRTVALQEVGDKCLLFSGLFPHIAEKRLVKISYFVSIGQAAYLSAAKATHDLFSSLAKHFVALMDVLQTLRVYSKKHPDLLPLEAYELWNEVSSQRALSVLKQHTHAVPVHTNLEGDDPVRSRQS